MKHKNKGVKKLSIKDFIFGNLFNGKSANYKAKDVLGNTISKTEQLIGFFEPTNRPVFRKAIPFNFTGLESYELAHNLDILNYIGIYYFSKQYGVRPLYDYISNQDKENLNNGYSINPEQKKLTITSDSLLNYNLIDGYIIIEYTKTNVESGLYCEDDIIDTNIDLQSLGQLCLTYANSNPNSCDPQPPIELIDVLLEFEKQICNFNGNTNISGIDTKCLVFNDSSLSETSTPKTLKEILQALIDKVCDCNCDVYYGSYGSGMGGL